MHAIGKLSLYISGSTNSKSNIYVKYVNMILRLLSANVFPKHTLLPALQGNQLIVFLFFPEGVRYKGLLGSNRSGKNSFGLYHSAGFLWSAQCKTLTWSPFLTVNLFAKVTSWSKVMTEISPGD